MTDYTPDPHRFQQLPLGGPTGKYDCTAWMAAWLAAAHSEGKVLLSGRDIRLASSEPTPNPKSPGLNLDQVDTALRRLTSPDIDLDTRIGIPTAAAQRLVLAGHWMGLQVNRGVLVDAGYGGPSRFRGGHALTIHAVGDVPVIGDELVPYYMRSSWSVVWRAAGALVLPNGTVRSILGAAAYATFTRDTTRAWQAVIHPPQGYTRQGFQVYRVDGGRITGRAASSTRGMSAACTEPRVYQWPGHPSKSIVRLKDGHLAGKWVASGWAEEMP